MGRERRPVHPAITAFFANLQTAFIAAGPPTYPRLVEIMLELQAKDPKRRALGKSALQSLLSGQNATLPLWEVLSAIIRALHAAAEETGLDPGAVGNLTHWNQQLAAARTPTGPASALRNMDEPDPGLLLTTDLDDLLKTDAFTTGIASTFASAADRSQQGRQDELQDLMILAQDEDDPDHAEAAYALAVLAICEGGHRDGKRWLAVAALAQHQPARALIISRSAAVDARAAALDLAMRYDRQGAAYLAQQFYRAARTHN